MLRRTLTTLLAGALLAGCAAQVPYPADGDPKAASGAGCPDLSGLFRNLPAATSDDAAATDRLPLTEVFFSSLLAGIAVTSRTTLDTGALVEALRLADPAVDSLLVSDLQAIRLRERISADYGVSIEMTFEVFVDYFDVDPVKDGHYFWHAHSIARPRKACMQKSKSAATAVGITRRC